MHQFHWIEERQEALHWMKRIGFWDDLFATLIAFAFLIDLVIISVRCLMNGTFWGPAPAWIASSFWGQSIDTPVIGFFMILLAISIIVTLGKAMNITGWEPIASLPAWYVATCVLVLANSLFPLVYPLSSIGVRSLSTVLLLIILGERRKARRKERKQAQTALAAQASRQTPPRVKHCEICQKVSPYEVCLDCEREHRVERHRVRSQVFRAKQAGVPATLTLKEWLDIVKGFHGMCAYCQSAPYVALEHFIPIVEGGGTTADNCVPACTSCNSKKSIKHPEKW